ncbi:MAG: hypothetical protein ACK4XJ_07305 [Fimbriimonadaceae bacterium]
MSAVPYGASKRAKANARGRRGVDRSQIAAAFFTCVLFLGLTAATFFASSLAGNVLVEIARVEGIEARNRTSYARQQEALLRGRIERLKSLDVIDQWASRHGMLPPERLASGIRVEGAVVRTP